MASAKRISKNLTLKNINQNVIRAEYAVRGVMSQTANKIREDLLAGTGNYPFDEIVECNIGNPQALGQKPISFYRQVLSGCINKDLMNSPLLEDGIKARAKYYNSKIQGDMGAYSESPGYGFVREAIAQFIQKRDGGIKSDPNKIILTDGASSGIEICFQALLSNSNEGVMIPIPQYPLYTALISLFGVNEVPYYLDEPTGWQITTKDLQKGYDDAVAKGVKPKLMVIINPGNPTGQVLTEDTISKIIEFAYNNGITILADEVYQQNVYVEAKKFVSFKKVVASMPEPYNNTELISFQSTSKGILGECGIRGGYFEWCNLDPEVEAQIHKLRTIRLCSNTNGQLLTDLMVRPPTEAENGKEVTERFRQETTKIATSMKRRSKIVYEALKNMKGITCNEAEGAMYAFPRIHLSKKAINEARSLNLAPDLFYTLEALKQTGICTVQGSGFRQKEDEYHFRITTLVTPDEKLERKMAEFKKFNDKFMDKWA